MKKVSLKYTSTLWSAYVPRRGAQSEENQTNLDKFIQDIRKGKKDGKRYGKKPEQQQKKPTKQRRL